MYNIGTGGTATDPNDVDHQDFGQKGFDIFSDMLSSDMVLGALNYGWYSTIADLTATLDYTTEEGYMPWRYYYRIIFAANGVIDALGGTDAEQTDPDRRYIMGQAKAMRAYGYFYLSHFYGLGYGDGTMKVLPLYTTSEGANQPKATTEEVYNLIISDLTQAIDYLEGFSRTSKDQVDQWVAKGLLAYAYATRGTTQDLENVVTITEDIINNSGFRLLNKNEVVAEFNANHLLINPQSGFNNASSPSWIWGVDLTLANNLDLVSWWGQVDLYTYSYAWAGDPKVIDSALYVSIHPDDVRKRQFVDIFEENLYYPINKFFAQHRVAELDDNEWGGQRNITSDYVYMRMEEMYLLNAEAHAKLGQDPEAISRLKELLELRIDDYDYVDALGGQALRDEIHLQTRIELWGEGKSYLALKRNKASVTRGKNHLDFAERTFDYDDPELTFMIPQAEILNNPVLNQ